MRKHFKQILCLVLVVLLAAAVLTLTGCKKKQVEALTGERISLGDGEKVIYFDVTFADEKTAAYEIHTDAETVGDALTENDLIEGEDSQYGLYVKTVCGETLDYTTDGKYWAFYENGEYAMTGVDSTAITDGAVYAMVATKG